MRWAVAGLLASALFTSSADAACTDSLTPAVCNALSDLQSNLVSYWTPQQLANPCGAHPWVKRQATKRPPSAAAAYLFE